MIREAILLISLGAGLAAPAIAQQPATATSADPFAKMRLDSAGDPADRLAGYLRTLANSPRDVDALTGAGRAALDVGDANAAVGFFARADSLSPKNGPIKAGLATALLRMDKPQEALRLFNNAVDLGVPEARIASDRGLAWDLRGEPKRAQKDYRLALAAGENAETTRRLALSLGISGDRAGAVQLLTPLLYKNDAAAWRARAFVLAMTGDVPGAEAIASSVMVSAQATAMKPFFARLASLDSAAKARAVHFGEMPSDGTAYSAAELAGMGASTPTSSYRPEDLSSPNSRRARAAAERLARNKAADDNAPPIPPPLSERAAARDEEAETARGAAPSAAELRAEKQRQAAEAKNRQTEASPERIWVQVASGANKRDLPRTWDSVRKKNATALKGRSPATARVGATNRLLVGPFKSEKDARAVVNKISGSFMVTTGKGEEVFNLTGKKIEVATKASAGKSTSGRKTTSSRKAASSKKSTAKKATSRKSTAKKATAKKTTASKKTTSSKKPAPKKKKK